MLYPSSCYIWLIGLNKASASVQEGHAHACTHHWIEVFFFKLIGWKLLVYKIYLYTKAFYTDGFKNKYI